MLISHKHKFITIDIPKTGTTSINKVLCSFMNTNDVNCGLSEDMGMRHGTYKDALENSQIVKIILVLLSSETLGNDCFHFIF